MSFAITPVTGLPPVTPTEPVQNIQFQFNGQNVGVRNTDTVNFSDLSQVLRVTIGVGEQVNVLTIGSAAPPEEGGWNTENCTPGFVFSEEYYLATNVGPPPA